MAFKLRNFAKKKDGEDQKEKISKLSGQKMLKFIVMFLPLFTWATIGVIIALALVLFIVPLYKDAFIYTKARIEQKETEVFNKEKELASLKRLKKEYDTITKENLGKIANIIPIGENIPSLISQLDAVAKSAGLELISFDISYMEDQKGKKKAKQTTNTSGIKELSINVTTSGGYYNSFKKMLTAFENNLRLFEVISVGYIPPLSELEAAGSTFTFNLKTFYREEVKGLSANTLLKRKDRN